MNKQQSLYRHKIKKKFQNRNQWNLSRSTVHHAWTTRAHSTHGTHVGMPHHPRPTHPHSRWPAHGAHSRRSVHARRPMHTRRSHHWHSHTWGRCHHLWGHRSRRWDGHSSMRHGVGQLAGFEGSRCGVNQALCLERKIKWLPQCQRNNNLSISWFHYSIQSEGELNQFLHYPNPYFNFIQSG
jgi:hypothetical protein